MFIGLNRTFTDDYLLKYSGLERRARRSTRSTTRSCAQVFARHGIEPGHRDGVAGRHPVGHGARLLGRLHGRPAARDLRVQARARDRSARSPRRRPTSRSTCSASRSASRTSTSPPSAGSPASSSTPTTASPSAPLAVSQDTLHDLEERLLLFFTGYSRSAGSILTDQHERTQRRRRADARQPRGHEGARPAHPRRARGRPAGGLRRADARALGGASGRARRGCPTSRSTLVRGRRRQRRDRRQAGRRRHRRLPDVLRRRPAAACGRRWRARGCARRALRSISTARPSSSATECSARSSPAAWPRGCARSPRPCPRRWSPSRAGRSPTTSSRGWPREGFDDVVYCIGHLGEQDPRLRRRRRAAGGCASRYVDEGAAPAGHRRRPAARARRGRRSRLAFAVLYGDSYLPADARARPGTRSPPRPAAALMTVLPQRGALRRLQRATRGRDGRSLRERRSRTPAAAGMHHIDYGFSILDRDAVIAALPEGEVVDLADVLRAR